MRSLGAIAVASESMKYRDVGITATLRPDSYQLWPVFSDPELLGRTRRLSGHVATLCIAKNIIRSREIIPGGAEWAARHFNRPFSRQRRCMVDCLERVGVCREVCEALKRVPRHFFVRDPYCHLSYINHTLPFSGTSSFLSAPQVVAVMMEATLRQGRAKAVELGAGSGYHMACLTAAGIEVVGYEANTVYADFGIQALRKAGLDDLLLIPDLLPIERMREATRGAAAYCTFCCSRALIDRFLSNMEPGTPLICPRVLTEEEFDLGDPDVYPKKKCADYAAYLAKPNNYLCISVLTRDDKGVTVDTPVLYDVCFVDAATDAFVEIDDPSADNVRFLRSIAPSDDGSEG